MTTSTSPTRSPASSEATNALAVLVADKFQASGLDRIRALGCRVDFEPDLGADALAEAIARLDPDVLIVRSTKVSGAAIDAAGRLSLIIRAGAGYDTIDVPAASARGIFVANCPGKNSVAVAELAWGLILSCDRRIPDQTADLREGSWDKKGYSKAAGLHGRTLGIVGLGRIGEAVAARGRAFGMRVIAWSRSLTEERAEQLGLERCETPIDVARRADVISLHVAANPETEHLVSEPFCEAMKPGAILVNTTRGSVVDEQALAAAIRSKGVRAGLDVFQNEPGAADSTFANPIAREPGVYGTHHVGASTDQAQEAIAAEAVRILECYANRGEVPHCVNRAASNTATCLLTVRHLNKAGVLAHVFGVLSKASINVEEMENIIYEGAAAACARIQLDSAPSPDELDAIRTNPHIISIDLTIKRSGNP